MDLWSAIRSSPRWINVASWGSLVLLLLKTLLLNRMVAPIAFLADLAPLADNLLASTFAAYLFFLLSVQIPAVQGKEHIWPYLADKLSSIAHPTTGFLTMVATAQGLKVPPQVTLDAVKELFAKTDPNGTSARSTRWPELRRLTWLQAMRAYLEDARPMIESTLRRSRYLDAELLALLGEIEDSRLLAALNEVLVVEAAGARVSDESLANWATAFWEQYLLERRVSDYRERMARRPVIDPA